MSMSFVALLFLFGAIALGFVKKSNVGLISLGAVLLLGKMGNLPLKKMYAGFPGKLFLTLLGTMFFFALLQENGTLDKASKKLTRLCGTKVFLVPIVVYVVSFVLSAIGPGAISVQTVMVLFAVPLAFHLDASPILLGAMAILGAVGGTASPIALTGIIVGDLLGQMRLAMPGMAIFAGVTVANALCALVVYIVFKGWKLRGQPVQAAEDPIRFDSSQKLSLLLIVALFVSVVGFSQDVGFVCFTLAFILLFTGKVDEKKAVKSLPWNTLILICGISVLMNAVKLLGGIDLLARGLAFFMSPATAPALMGFTGGIMSWFSSANGVVFPTLIPTVPQVAVNVGGTSQLQMVAAIVCSATVAGISPMSTGGSLVMASCSQEKKGKQTDSDSSLFAKLFGVSALCVAIIFVFTLVGGLSFLH
ncbi:SLC13 family permease [Acidaminococcus sp.]|uniref:SLC13 family permease n=1 Tax=Acidaminococcus sp. TaxID=1872103 RepID=UPI003D7D076A